ncbi:unnamed protein product [Mesocestoides corti]|uniref:OB_NTP_bind domain-containing protein n=1 Tax=Mesocestoides corti TaxID=53468 RepID=A0A0R3UQI5_MESCO|nr:unnamed protein product [Mesocestoides corti]
MVGRLSTSQRDSGRETKRDSTTVAATALGRANFCGLLWRGVLQHDVRHDAAVRIHPLELRNHAINAGVERLVAFCLVE